MKKKMITLLLATTITLNLVTGCSTVSETQAECITECPAMPGAEDYEVDYNESAVSAYTESVPAASEENYASDYSDSAPCAEEYETPVTAVNSACEEAYYEDAYAEDLYEDYYDNDCYSYSENGENYTELAENNFISVKTSPYSTFAADVDTASYSNFRRMVNDGYGIYDIPKGSIRAEEMINYFDYNYSNPQNNNTFGVCSAITDCPWNKKSKLVTIGVKARDYSEAVKTPSNIVFLIDVSGSMDSYDKLDLLKEGFEMLVDNLDSNDRVSIVTYASSSEIALDGVAGDNHTKLKRAMNKLSAGGSTNGGDGIVSAYRLAQKHFIKGGNNRVIMATDGDLNVGITNQSELEKLINDKKEGGVYLSVLGFGTGNYNESNLETLADKGNGNYSYIDSLAEAKKVLVDEFNSTLLTVAKDTKMQIEFNPLYVSSYRQIGYENRSLATEDFLDDKKDGGEVGYGHTVTVMYEVFLNDDATGEDVPDSRYQNTVLSDKARESGEWMTLSIRYKNPDNDKVSQENFPISKNCYVKNPSNETQFAIAVAELSMLLNDSYYSDNIDINDIKHQLSKIKTNDPYKAEFIELVNEL